MGKRPMFKKNQEHSSEYPKVRIVQWGPRPRKETRSDEQSKGKFVESQQMGFLLHNDGSQAALSIQLEKTELICSPEEKILISSPKVNVGALDDVFLPVRVNKAKPPLGNYNFIGALARYCDRTHEGELTWFYTLELPICLTYHDWQGSQYRVKSNLTFKRLRPTGIISFDVESIEPLNSNASRDKSLRGFAGLKDKEISSYIAGAPLTVRQRDCAHLRYGYDLTITEIAERLEISRATVQEHLAAATKKIQNSQDNTKSARRIRVTTLTE
jgi:DNA-binding CsgD family transcriptional regulator